MLSTMRTRYYSWAKQRLSPVPWNGKDVVIVVSITMVFPALVYCLMRLARIEREGWLFPVYTFNGIAAHLLVPLLWAKKRYHTTWAAFGLRGGVWSFAKHVPMGAASGLAIFLLANLGEGNGHPTLSAFLRNATALKPAPFNSWFAVFPYVVGPFAEEVYYRGFFYGYMRQRLGIIMGLVGQALFFSLCHFPFFHATSGYFFYTFSIGTLLGLLFEVSGSIYPSMISHMALNYLAGVAAAP